MDDASQKNAAFELIQKGLTYIGENKIKEAVDCFQRSIEICKTPEGYTYWGWAVSFYKKFDEAIFLCKKAIGMDPDFGNPYNDIGCYLVELGDFDQAIEWFEKAKSAKRYETRYFPYLNLGRLYLKNSDIEKAKKEFLEVINLSPFNLEAQKALYRISCLEGKNKHFYFCSLN